MTRRPFLLGLTGSIAMGKSTTAAFFVEAGIPVWDADAAVHRLYAAGGGGAAALRGVAPQAVSGGEVDRARLREAATADPGLLPHIEAAVHPLVAEDRAAFLRHHEGEALIVLDIPLLFETGAECWLDGVLVVSAPPEVQRARALPRPVFSEAAYAAILARQTPDAEKRAKADFVIETDKGLEAARRDVLSVIEAIRKGRANA